jgi:hypothetical protein
LYDKNNKKGLPMEESQIIDIWSLFKDYLDKKTISVVCEKYIDMIIDYGVGDDKLKEMLGNDPELDKAILYYLDDESDDGDYE